tara:strand:- start:234 stop:1022 length:789 start_codon:yes stop_codon:yes gene_type:complete
MEENYRPLTREEIDAIPRVKTEDLPSIIEREKHRLTEFENLDKKKGTEIEIVETKNLDPSEFTNILKQKTKDIKVFEKRCIRLHKRLSKKFKDEFPQSSSQSNKIDFIQKLMNRIIEVKYEAKNKTNTTEITEEELADLNDLFIFFENELNKLYQPSPFLKNKYPKIFKDDFSFNLFLQLHEEFKKDGSHRLANYSFIFYAMTEDQFNLMICRPTDFIKFLRTSDFDIDIEKIDSRQSGQNKRLSLYKAIKQELRFKFRALH